MLQIRNQSWAPPIWYGVKGAPGQLWANTSPSIAPNMQKYPLTRLVTRRHPAKFKSSPTLLRKWRSKSQSESPSLLTDITRDGHGPEKFTAWPFVYTWRLIQFQVRVNMKQWDWRKPDEGYPVVFAPKSMAHGNRLPFLNFKPFLETEVLQKNFLGLSKTIHLCQHHRVLWYLLSRVRRNGLLLPRKNTNSNSSLQLCPFPTLRTAAHSSIFSLSSSPCWLCIENTNTHPALPCCPSSQQWEATPPSPGLYSPRGRNSKWYLKDQRETDISIHYLFFFSAWWISDRWENYARSAARNPANGQHTQFGQEASRGIVSPTDVGPCNILCYPRNLLNISSSWKVSKAPNSLLLEQVSFSKLKGLHDLLLRSLKDL